MINKKEIVAMLLAGGQGSRSLTSHCQTVQTQELTQSEF